jgi:hypothetical protein
MTGKRIVRLFGVRTSWSPHTVPLARWLFALLIGLGLACTLVVLSGCAATSCGFARSMSYYCPEELQKKMAGGQL